MRNTVKFLVALLAVQVILIAAINLNTKDIAAKAEPVALASFEQEHIDEILIEGPDKEKVQLVKQDGQWVLPDVDHFPANTNKINQLLNKLASLQVTRPVATSESAQQRFKVSEELFERRIRLSSNGNAVAQLYLGTSPSMRLIHAREEHSDQIFTVAMSTYEMPVELANWEDKSLLEIDKTTVTSLSVNGITIQREGRDKADDGAGDADDLTSAPNWHAADLSDDTYLDNDAVNALIDTLATLQYDSVLGQEDKPEYKLSEPVLSLTITTDNDDTVSYTIGKQESGTYVLSASSRPEYFKLASYRATSLIDASKPQTLTPFKEKEANQDDNQQTEDSK